MKRFAVRIWMVAGALVGLTTMANATPPYEMKWATLDGGGGWSYGGLLSLSGTIGQPDDGYMSAGGFEIFGGFWKGVSTETVCQADFDDDGFVTGVDFDLFVYAFEAGDLASDFDLDGFITGADFDLYVQAFEAGC